MSRVRFDLCARFTIPQSDFAVLSSTQDILGSTFSISYYIHGSLVKIKCIFEYSRDDRRSCSVGGSLGRGHVRVHKSGVNIRRFPRALSRHRCLPAATLLLSPWNLADACFSLSFG